MSVPTRFLSSDAIDARYGRPAGWLQKRCGVETRYHCLDETQEGLGADAARRALADGGIDLVEVDLVIAACGVGRQALPSTAPMIARALGIPHGRCFAFDVDATCLSFLAGLEAAAAMIETGSFKTALVVSSDIASRALPWESAPDVAGLFGDGAAAAVIVHDETSKLRWSSRFETHHDGYEYNQITAGGTAIDYHAEPERFAAGSLFAMDGHALFRLTSERFPVFVDKLLDAAGWAARDVDLVIPHQASPLALRHLATRCGFGADRVIDIVARYGNQVAASIPTALHLGRATGRLGRGTKALMLGTSAGINFGGIAFEVVA